MNQEPDATRRPDPDRTLALSSAAERARLTHWGPLELIEKIGEGGFGETFRARDPWLDREVALKLFKRGIESATSVRERVIREGALLARVSHPHVVTVHGAERHANRVGMWMELIRGETLSARVRREGPLDEREAVVIGLDLCRALAAVHAAGIVHRDIKGGNVMREEGGRIVLMDFGAGLDVSTAATGDVALTGTPFYMAPELLAGQPATVRSDLYAVGVLLYHLVTGKHPVRASSFMSLREAHRSGSRIPLTDRRDDLTPGFVAVVERCLAPDPSARYAAASEVQQALAGLLGGKEGRAAATFDFTTWRHARIAEWSHPRYRLDTDFVALTLLIDHGEEATERWRARSERHRDLVEVLAAVEDPALVVLGPPGCGKSTLLRRLELDVARDALASGGDQVTFFLPLNHYREPGQGETPSDPGKWLADRWCARYPELPPLDDLIRQGRMLLLLDALNEIPASSATSRRDAVVTWKGYLDRLLTENPGNRVVFSCRALDYSAPLSTSSLRVPQVVIEPMTDEQVGQYLAKTAPEHGGAIWKDLAGTPQLEVMRSPYFLSLLVDQVEAEGEMPEGRAGLFTGFIRNALRREVERENPLFAPDELLTERDVRRITQWRWKNPWELPERGALVRKISDLAFGMQDASADGGASQVRIEFKEALDLLDDDRDEDIVRAGVALSVLDEDVASDEVLFFHQLLQEYFAGRKLSVSADSERVRAPWQAAEITPPLREVLALLPGSETLPSLPTTGWEETTLLAVVMAENPDRFVRKLMETNLALAGRCAGQPDVCSRLTPELLGELRVALVARSTDRAAELRARIDAGLALGPLGDPRFERRTGPHGDFLVPPMVDIAGGRYPMGADEQYEYLGVALRSHMPRHAVNVASFSLARFPVTNAEWALFQDSGGYEEERWWETEGARRWRSGEGTGHSMRANVRYLTDVFRRDPQVLATAWKSGQVSEEGYELQKMRLSMSEAELEAHLEGLFPSGVLREPTYWRDPAYNNPAQPVVGVSWFEARAYCRWLSVQSGEPYRLPTEAEWEAAARGHEGRLFAYGNQFDALKGNTAETRLKRPTPVGVFVEGDTPEGVSDLSGNVAEWTTSLFGPGIEFEEASFAYPYRVGDGRENLEAGSEVRRVLRGAFYASPVSIGAAAYRGDFSPDIRIFDSGFRLARSAPPSIGPSF